MTAPLYCEICDRDVGTPEMVLTHWQDIDVCLECLAHKAAMDAEDDQERFPADACPGPGAGDGPLERGHVEPRHW